MGRGCPVPLRLTPIQAVLGIGLQRPYISPIPFGYLSLGALVYGPLSIFIHGSGGEGS